MSKRHKYLRNFPSLRSLYIFEAAARHLNLIRAAEELGLTQGALSRQIKSLEEHLGVLLFVRSSRGLLLTEAGDILQDRCVRAFLELEEGIGAISDQRGRHSLLLAVARSYATRVLSPRVLDFCTKNPFIDLILSGHRHLSSLTRNEADAAIRFGDGFWEDVSSERIGSDRIFPVASPALIKRAGTDDLGALTASCIILDSTERSIWNDWCELSNCIFEREFKRVRFSETTMILEAVESGQGIAVVRESLVSSSIAEGRLTMLSSTMVDDGFGFYFCTSEEGRRKSAVIKFRNWLFEERNA